MDTAVDNAIHVYYEDGNTRRFALCKCNLYYYYMSQEEGTLLTIMSVEGNKESVSDLDCRRAEKARRLQEVTGSPTTKDLTICMINNKLIANTTVSQRDVQNAEKIYGKHTSIIKRKQTCINMDHMCKDITKVPFEVLDNYRDVRIYVDIMTVNGIRFFHSISRHRNF